MTNEKAPAIIIVNKNADGVVMAHIYETVQEFAEQWDSFDALSLDDELVCAIWEGRNYAPPECADIGDFLERIPALRSITDVSGRMPAARGESPHKDVMPAPEEMQRKIDTLWEQLVCLADSIVVGCNGAEAADELSQFGASDELIAALGYGDGGDDEEGGAI